jgi:preprotein translocase subunit SecG
MTSILLVSQFILTAILTISVLLQKSSSIGLGAYSGSNESLFGAKGPAGFLAKFTFAIGFIFVLNTLALGYFYNTEKKGSLAEQIESTVPPSASPSVPKAPEAPKAD